jgi:hypothetical protein
MDRTRGIPMAMECQTRITALVIILETRTITADKQFLHSA